MQLVLAIILGAAFGFIMHRAGIANPNRIINMLRLKDFHLMKVIFFAIGFSSLVLVVLVLSDVIVPEHLHIKSAYIGVLVGGALFGLGFAVSGYCPGTCLVGAGAKRKDALFFIAGGLIGALAFTFSYSYLETTWLFSDIAGKTTVTNHEVADTLVESSAFTLFITFAISSLFMAIAWFLPNNTPKTNA